MFKLNQKGAMFGLDTRVALAVMGAMSVIAGYYSISRIGTAKTAGLVKELSNYEEAFLGYQSDMGTFLLFTLNGASNGVRDLEVLWDQSEVLAGLRKRWSGPYYKYKSYTRDHSDYGEFSITYGQDDANLSTCTSSTSCYAWLTLSDVPLETWLEINEAVDEAYGSDAEASAEEEGKVRADSLGSDPLTLYYRVLERPTN